MHPTIQNDITQARGAELHRQVQRAWMAQAAAEAFRTGTIYPALRRPGGRRG